MMNRKSEILESSPSLSLDATPVSLRLPAGAAVFALRGTVWLTQERLRDDIILAPGDRFDVRSSAPIVVSAVDHAATLVVAPPAAARVHAERDVYDFARAQAFQLRREAIARMALSVRAAIAACMARLHTMLATRPRAASH